MSPIRSNDNNDSNFLDISDDCHSVPTFESFAQKEYLENDRSFKIIKETLIQEMKDATKIHYDNQKLSPFLSETSSRQLCLRCPFFPSCQRYYIIVNGEIIQGQVLTNFRNHKCNGIGRSIRLTIKAKEIIKRIHGLNTN